jgi:DNA-binding response OmpR family regulator
MKVWAASNDKNFLNSLNIALRVHWPSSGKVIAAEIAESFSPLNIEGCDLAIVDVSMHNFDTVSLVEGIRSCSSLPILVLSSPKDDQTTTARALTHGANDYCFKPVTILDLVFRIENLAKPISVSCS